MTKNGEVLEVQGKVENLNIYNILLDTGAAANFVSYEWVVQNNMYDKMTESTLNHVELGATGNKMEIMGKIRLTVAIEEVTTEVTFEVFDTKRSMILGMRTLLLHFFPILVSRVHQIRHMLGEAEEHNKLVLNNMDMNIGAKRYPKEPHGHLVEEMVTTLQKEETILLHSHEKDQAPELYDIENEYKNMTVQDLEVLGDTEYDKLIDSGEMLSDSFILEDKFKQIMKDQN